MKTLGIITASFRRQKILTLWCASIERIRRDVPCVLPVVVVSGKEDRSICANHNVYHIDFNNFPISEKFNRGMQWAKGSGVDYAMVSGSDDIFSTDTIRRIISEMEKGYSVIGIDSIYFYSTEGIHKGKLCHLNGQRILGVGKTISKEVLERVDYRPWGVNKNWGLDALVTQSIAPYIRSESVLSDTVVVDCKGKDNINKARLWFKKLPMIDPNIFYDILGEEEKQILKTI